MKGGYISGSRLAPSATQHTEPCRVSPPCRALQASQYDIGNAPEIARFSGWLPIRLDGPWLASAPHLWASPWGSLRMTSTGCCCSSMFQRDPVGLGGAMLGVRVAMSGPSAMGGALLRVLHGLSKALLSSALHAAGKRTGRSLARDAVDRQLYRLAQWLGPARSTDSSRVAGVPRSLQRGGEPKLGPPFFYSAGNSPRNGRRARAGNFREGGRNRTFLVPRVRRPPPARTSAFRHSLFFCLRLRVHAPQ